MTITERRNIPSSMPGEWVPENDTNDFWRNVRIPGISRLGGSGFGDVDPAADLAKLPPVSTAVGRTSQFSRHKKTLLADQLITVSDAKSSLVNDPKTTLGKAPPNVKTKATTLPGRVATNSKVDLPVTDQPLSRLLFEKRRPLTPPIEDLSDTDEPDKMTKGPGEWKTELEFVLSVPACGWGIEIAKGAKPPDLPEGLRYWDPSDSESLGEDGAMSWVVPTTENLDAQVNWPVFSWPHNTSEKQRNHADHRPAPYTLPDEQTIFLICQWYNPLDRYKRWPYTFSKSGAPRTNRRTFGIPPVVAVGSWRKNDKDRITFFYTDHFYLSYKGSHTLKGVDGSNKVEGKSWKDKRGGAKGQVDWTFGAAVTKVDKNSAARKSSNDNIQLWYAVDGRETKKQFEKHEIWSTQPSSAWFERLRTDNRAAVYAEDSIFNSEVPT